MAYAKGSKAFGFCDRTGFRYPLSDLVYEYQNGQRTGFRVGRDVRDPDQPQSRMLCGVGTPFGILFRIW
jgi:hypothetical protein